MSTRKKRQQAMIQFVCLFGYDVSRGKRGQLMLLRTVVGGGSPSIVLASLACNDRAEGHVTWCDYMYQQVLAGTVREGACELT